MRIHTPVILAAAVAAFLPSAFGIPVPINAFNTAFTENFDSLVSSGTGSSLPAGWEFSESGTNANLLYTAGTGSSTTADTYGFGAAGSTERALGTLRSNTFASIIGVQFTNETGLAINSLLVAYTGEQWRLGAADRNDRLDFQYSLDATSLTTGTWTDVDELDFASPVIDDTGMLDGNAPSNRLAISYTLDGLAIASAQGFWFRWTDFNASGADDGLAIDDFSIIALQETVTSPPSVPDSISLGFIACVLGSALFAGRHHRARS